MAPEERRPSDILGKRRRRHSLWLNGDEHFPVPLHELAMSKAQNDLILSATQTSCIA